MSEELEAELKEVISVWALWALIFLSFVMALFGLFICSMAASHYSEVIATHWGIYS